MQPIWTIAAKDLKQLVRDKAGLFWVIGFPLLIAIFFGSIFGGSSGSGASKMKIAIDDMDRSSASKAFIDKIKESAAVDATFESFKIGQNSVRKGEIVAAVRIPKGFGDSSPFSGQQPALTVAIDPGRKAEAGFLEGILAQASFAPMQQSLSDPVAAKAQMERSRRQILAANMDPSEKQNLMTFLGDATRYFAAAKPGEASTTSAFSGPKIKEVGISEDQSGPKSPYEITFPQGIIWGLIAVAMAFAIGTVKERVGGTYLRLQIAPISKWQFLAGKGLACFLGCVGVIVVLLAVGSLAFHVHYSSPTLLAMGVVCSSICFTGITMLLSVIGKTEAAASGGGRAVLLLCSMFGGGMIPEFIMPAWMQPLSSVTPVKWSIVSLEGAIWRGFSLQEMLLPCGILIAFGVITFGIGTFILSKTHD